MAWAMSVYTPVTCRYTIKIGLTSRAVETRQECLYSSVKRVPTTRDNETVFFFFEH